MTEYYYETDARTAGERVQRSTPAASRRKWILRATILLLWIIVAAGSFYFVYSYMNNMQQKLVALELAEAANQSALLQRLDTLEAALGEQADLATGLRQQLIEVQSNLEAVNEELSLAGDSLDTSAETRQALNDRISDLSKELDGLRKLISKLEEAARVY